MSTRSGLENIQMMQTKVMLLLVASKFNGNSPSSKPGCIDTTHQLDQLLDCNSGGVSKYLGQIADSMHEWEGPVAEELGLSLADISVIRTAHPTNFNLQV